jgi:SanA protein
VRRLSRRRKIMIVMGVLIVLSPFALLVALRAYSAIRARGEVYTVETVPAHRVAIVFGAQVWYNGQPSHMLADRVAAGADLYHAGKADVLLMSGDNHVQWYNEPVAMRDYALALGVPDEAIVLDYAGFRTYDSCYRAREVFQVESAILVTQKFHMDRALLTCSGLGLDVVGVTADYQRPVGYQFRTMVFSTVREFPATALAVVDLLRRPQPTYLGEPLPIVAQANPNR